MAVIIRMKRVGRTNSPAYRIVATDEHFPRDGRIVENLGNYYPTEKDAAKQVTLDDERAKYWMSVGALTSATVARIFKKRGRPTRVK